MRLALILQFALKLLNALLQPVDFPARLRESNRPSEPVTIAFTSFPSAVGTGKVGVAFQAVHAAPVAGSRDLTTPGGARRRRPCTWHANDEGWRGHAAFRQASEVNLKRRVWLNDDEAETESED